MKPKRICVLHGQSLPLVSSVEELLDDVELLFAMALFSLELEELDWTSPFFFCVRAFPLACGLSLAGFDLAARLAFAFGLALELAATAFNTLLGRWSSTSWSDSKSVSGRYDISMDLAR